MRIPYLLFGIGLAASCQATPILLTLAGDIGTFQLTYDLDGQPPGFTDIHDRSGDYLNKLDDYRINDEDFFTASVAGMGDGYGYDWLLERFPVATGIYESFSEVFITRPNGLFYLTGPMTTEWKPGTSFLGIIRDGDSEIRGDLTVTEASAPMVPEASSAALLLLGIAVLGTGAVRRRAITAAMAGRAVAAITGRAVG